MASRWAGGAVDLRGGLERGIDELAPGVAHGAGEDRLGRRCSTAGLSRGGRLPLWRSSQPG